MRERVAIQEWSEDLDEKTGWHGHGWFFKDTDEYVDDEWELKEVTDTDKFYNPIEAIFTSEKHH